MKVKEEYELCRKKSNDEKINEYNQSLFKRLELFMEISPKLMNQLQLQLDQTKNSFQTVLQIFGETLTVDGKTIEGNEVSIIFMNTLTKIISSLIQTKKDIEKNTQLSNEIKFSLQSKDDPNLTPTSRSNNITTPPPPPPKSPSLELPTSSSTTSTTTQVESIVVETLLPSSFISSPVLSRRKSQTLQQSTPPKEVSSSNNEINTTTTIAEAEIQSQTSTTNQEESNSINTYDEKSDNLNNINNTNIEANDKIKPDEIEIKENVGKKKTEKSKNSRPKARNVIL